MTLEPHIESPPKMMLQTSRMTCSEQNWIEVNNMVFNSLKFKILHNGKDLELKQDTMYVSPE